MMMDGPEHRRRISSVAICLFLFGPTPIGLAQLSVLSVEPAARSRAAPLHGPITIRFDRAVRRDTVTNRSFHAFGRWSGPVVGDFAFSEGDRAVTLFPRRWLSAGEMVMVVLSHDLGGADGSSLRAAGYSFQFWTAAAPGVPAFTEIDRLTTRTTPAVRSRAYGGIATDLDSDGYLDMTIVNEDTADLRVFMNRADRTGLFHPFIQPTTPVRDRASPSEPADFNFDGVPDICVAAINDNSVSILLGNGDGTFQPQQRIVVGAAPRGIAVLDVDGDGDVDIVNTNADGSNLSIMLNNGAGVFGAPAFFEGGGSSEWALAAADMNGDGILDLVIGARSSQQVLINRGNGDGTFSFDSAQNCDGAVWMLGCGDLNGDGAEDVGVVNSTSNRAAILLGNGAGQLAAPVRYATDPFPLAMDFGDLDGDGDLDWLTSSFSGDWFVFTNNGAGVFTFLREIDAPQAASCCLLMDADKDGDLDLSLIDELEDVVILMRNGSAGPCVGLGDFNVNGRSEGGDLAPFIDAVAQGGNWTPAQLCAGDFTGDGMIAIDDVGPFVNWLLGL